MAITPKKWIRLAENEIKGAERAAGHISEALSEYLEYGKKYPGGLVRFFGAERAQATDDSYRRAGREIREAVRHLKKAKQRLEKQAKARRTQLAKAKHRLKQ